MIGGCQYILSVGGTQNFSPEVMVDISLAGFYSGAGFSNYFPMPSYQTSAVAAYEAELNATDNGFYNTTGRAYPDVSAQGSRQEIVVAGLTGLGTCHYKSSSLRFLLTTDTRLFLFIFLTR